MYEYIKMVKRLLPKSVRDATLDNASVGEKHKWMYDSHSLKTLLLETGFSTVNLLDADTSGINGFPEDHLAEPVFSVVSRHAKNESLSTSGNAICIELADCIF